MFFKNNFKIITALSAVTQTTLCLIVPVGLCIGAGKWLVEKQGFPQFTMIVAILLGVLSGFYSMVKYIMGLIKLNDADKNGRN